MTGPPAVSYNSRLFYRDPYTHYLAHIRDKPTGVHGQDICGPRWVSTLFANLLTCVRVLLQASKTILKRHEVCRLLQCQWLHMVQQCLLQNSHRCQDCAVSPSSSPNSRHQRLSRSAKIINCLLYHSRDRRLLLLNITNTHSPNQHSHEHLLPLR